MNTAQVVAVTASVVVILVLVLWQPLQPVEWNYDKWSEADTEPDFNDFGYSNYWYRPDVYHQRWMKLHRSSDYAEKCEEVLRTYLKRGIAQRPLKVDGRLTSPDGAPALEGITCDAPIGILVFPGQKPEAHEVIEQVTARVDYQEKLYVRPEAKVGKYYNDIPPDRWVIIERFWALSDGRRACYKFFFRGYREWLDIRVRPYGKYQMQSPDHWPTLDDNTEKPIDRYAFRSGSGLAFKLEIRLYAQRPTTGC